MKPAIELIADERARQISVEGWTPAHDDLYQTGELASAAACYAMTPVERCEMRTSRETFRQWLWPWSAEWWKPSPEDRVRELVKAGALIAAEIDRLQRMPASAPVCAECHGTGRDAPHTDRWCDACAGTGYSPNCAK